MPYCIKCGGAGFEGKKCPLCGKRKKILTQDKNKVIIDKQSKKARLQFLMKMREKLIMFNMKTTGSEEVDEEIKRTLGPW